MVGFVTPVPGPSPDVGNYYIGRGIVSIQLPGDPGFVDCGNVTQAEFTVKPTVLPHYSSRVGTRFKDFTATVELEASVDCTLEEFTGRNMGFMLLGISTQVGGVETVDMFSQAQFYAAFKFTGTNDVGPQWSFTCPLVQLTPQKAFSLIAQGSGSWGAMDVHFDILKDPVTGQFCIATSATAAS